MRWIRVLEHGRIPVVEDGETPPDGAVNAAERRRLGHADRWRGAEGGSVFHWRAHALVARHWVGVLQVPGISVEILPKIEGGHAAPGGDAESLAFARQNLLYMLAVAGDLPLRERDIADLSLQRMPLSETLLALFATRLDEALRIGVEHGYVTEEDELPVLRGKLVPARQAAKLPARLDRFALRFERFCEDTPLNRILKAACRAGLHAEPAAGTGHTLRRCVGVLDDVADLPVPQLGLDRVQLTRQNERFRTLFNFARLILGQQAPTASSGATRTFSLLFDMNAVFERFVAGFLQRYVLPAFPAITLRAQARGYGLHLLNRGETGVLRLKPDLVLTDGTANLLVVDTKWKRLDAARREIRPSREDLYQMFAYAHRFQCSRNALLYPLMEGLEPHDYAVPDPSGARIGVRFIGLSRDLRANRKELADELVTLLARELGIEPVERAA